jgi:ribA/ribD-fused uncharacterized protein
MVNPVVTLPPINYRSTVYDRARCAVFFTVKGDNGHLSNMASSYPLMVNGLIVGSTEALYQAMRFPHRLDLQRRILEQKSPMYAKRCIAGDKAESRPDWRDIRVEVMRWVEALKLCQHTERFGGLLLSTGDKPMVEQSSRDDFWGAKVIEADQLMGINALGQLLDYHRDQFRENPLSYECIEPPPIDNLLLLGRPVGTVRCRDSLPPAATSAGQESQARLF